MVDIAVQERSSRNLSLVKTNDSQVKLRQNERAKLSMKLKPGEIFILLGVVILPLFFSALFFLTDCRHNEPMNAKINLH